MALVITILLSTIPLVQVKANPEVVYIRSDGSIDPPIASIKRDGDLYVLTDNINASIIVQKNNIVIDGAGFIIQGSGSGYPRAEYGIDLSSRNNVKIMNTRITRFYDGIYLDDSSSNTISGNEITGNEDQGIRVAIHSASYNTISGNIVTDNGGTGIFLGEAFDNTISGNIVTDNGHIGISLWGDDNTLFDNMVAYNGLMGIDIWTASYNTVSNNNVTNSDYGIRIAQSSSYNTVSNNNVTNSDYGVYIMYASSNNTLFGNIVKNNQYHGIYLDESANTLSNNTVTNNEYGIYLSVWSGNTRISGNIVKNNRLYGVYLHYSNETLIFSNNITDNNYGIGLSNSYGNLIHHNYFIDNALQVQSISSINIWDDDYPSGGNHWSDYIGVDQKSGPNQDQPGSDGIGDTPYVINQNNRDNYPLVRPSTNLSAVKLELGIQSDVNQLYANNVNATITVKIKNTGDYIARNVSLTVTIPSSFEVLVATTWSGDLEPGVEKVISFNAKAIRCVNGTFEARVTYKDENGDIVSIPKKSATVNVKDWILIQHYGPNTKINLSPTSHENAKDIMKAESIIAALWVMTLIIDLNLTELEAANLLEYADEFISWLRQLWENGEVDPETIAMLADWIASVALNTLGLWIVVNYREDLIKEDGTIDFNAIWLLSAIEDVLNTLIDTFVSMIFEAIEQDKLQEFLQTNQKTTTELLILQEVQGKLYMNVTVEEKKIKTHYSEGLALVVLPPEATKFKFVVDSKEAHKNSEDYNVSYLTMTSKGIETKGLLTNKLINKPEKQEYMVSVDSNGILKVEEIVPRMPVGEIVIGATIIVAIIVVAVALKKRKKPKQ
jgi:parallel beta-helix repeat protein